MNAFLQAIKVKARIINALFIQTILSEHGKTRVGYLAAVIKPIGQIVMLTTMFSVLGRASPLGDNLVIFFATGLIPYNLCMGLANKMLQMNKSSRMILSSTPATPFDVSIAFLLSESLILLIASMIILVGLGDLGYWDHNVDSLLGILLTSIAAIVLGYGLGLFNSSLATIMPSYEKIWRILSMPIFLMSGVFFVASRSFPPEAIEILKFNPLLHIIESMRDSFYRSWESTLFDLGYLLWALLYVSCVGLLMQKLTQKRIRT